MIAKSIGFVLRNLPAFLLVIALLAAAFHRGRWSMPERFLSWLLLLPVGVTGLWAGVFHLFFPSIAAADIGWQLSPFQFEVGMADLAIGATAVASFWCSLPFKAAAVWCRRFSCWAMPSAMFIRCSRRATSRPATPASRSSWTSSVPC